MCKIARADEERFYLLSSKDDGDEAGNMRSEQNITQLPEWMAGWKLF